MAPQSRLRFAPRPRRIVLIASAIALSFTIGCSGRRQSMRPVYLSPSTARPCPSGDCGGSSLPTDASVTSGPTTSTSVDSSVMSSGANTIREAPVITQPTYPDSPPAVSSPQLEAAPDEPGLPAPSDSKTKAPAAKPSGGVGSRGVAPGASLRSTTGRSTTPPRLKQASLSRKLEAFVDDPESLTSPPKADRPWRYIVLHHSASPTGGYDSIDREHRERLGWQGCGYHFVIGNGSETPDGKIEVSQRWTNQKLGVHCRDGKNPDINEYGIGVCLVGDLEKSPPTERQVAAARLLVAYLGERYQIAPSKTETHAHLAASPTSCPGRLFPSDSILGHSSLVLR